MPLRRIGLDRIIALAMLGLMASTCVGVGDVDPPSLAAQAIGSNCAPAEPEAPRLLRQLSMDLRGGPPTFEELEAAAAAGAVTPAMIDGMLASSQFIDQASRWHADILWPNLDGFLIQAGGIRLTRGGTNPEVNLDILDARTSEATCPASGNGALTASVCCTAASPNHPACCMARNRVFNATDPACIEKARRLGAVFTIGLGLGDRPLRGGNASAGCDDALEYPPAHVARDDASWLHDSSGRPYYLSPRSRQVRYYYDDDDVPLPYDDWTHCPNFCRANVGSGPGGVFGQADYVSKSYVTAGRTVQGDSPTARCPDGFTEVVNTCDNALVTNNESIVRIRREGYRMMRPYWADGHLIKVCAYEAQERTNSAYSGLPCTPATRMDSSCGCGPSGLYCTPSQGRLSVLPTQTERRIRSALDHEPLQIVASVISRNEDYFQIYTTRRSFITGALFTMYREQLPRMTGLTMTAPTTMASLPNVPYEDEGWHEYVRGAEHSGVLTTPAYLGRFPTWRSRINRFRTSLLCRPFEPPVGGLPPPDDACNREPNLAHRCGCQHCHASIEPLGAYWGRWSERAAVYLDPIQFPTFDPNCAQCATTGQFCSPRCRTNYVTNVIDADGSRFAGTLLSALYRSPDEMSRIEQGPAALVANALSTGEMQACTVNTLWRRLVGRVMNDQETREVLPELLREFESNHHNYRSLVRAVVTAPAYRRID